MSGLIRHATFPNAHDSVPPRWLRLQLKFRRAFVKYWTLCHILLPIAYALLDLGAFGDVSSLPRSADRNIRDSPI
jgi:hypothetical protein